MGHSVGPLNAPWRCRELHGVLKSAFLSSCQYEKSRRRARALLGGSRGHNNHSKKLQRLARGPLDVLTMTTQLQKLDFRVSAPADIGGPGHCGTACRHCRKPGAACFSLLPCFKCARKSLQFLAYLLI